MKDATTAVKGITVEIRGADFSWKATVHHLGGGGTEYAKFNGRWMRINYDSIPSGVYRRLRSEVNDAVRSALA